MPSCEAVPACGLGQVLGDTLAELVAGCYGESSDLEFPPVPRCARRSGRFLSARSLPAYRVTSNAPFTGLLTELSNGEDLPLERPRKRKAKTHPLAAPKRKRPKRNARTGPTKREKTSAREAYADARRRGVVVEAPSRRCSGPRGRWSRDRPATFPLRSFAYRWECLSSHKRNESRSSPRSKQSSRLAFAALSKVTKAPNTRPPRSYSRPLHTSNAR